jgi:hypothetical protein
MDYGLLPITERALVQRINRKLKGQGEALRTTRGRRGDLGDFYVVDLNRNFVVDKHVDLEECGRELGVLKPHERMAES